MTEREQDNEPYWQHDVEIGEGRTSAGLAMVRLRVHQSEERYWEREELVPITPGPGQRFYFQARPYILEPEITLTMELYPQATASGAIGEVVSSEWAGMRHHEIGNAQGWYYPKDRTLVLWEAYLHDQYREDKPCEDATLDTLWRGWERFLLEHSKGVKRIVTPAWEELYEGDLWQEFLRTQGYAPFNERAFVKEVAAG